MTQVLEKIAEKSFGTTEEECPFKEKDPKNVEQENEDIEKDERDHVQHIQENDGGVLGKNLEAGSAGAEGTVNELYVAPKHKEEPYDTKRNAGGKVKVDHETHGGAYPYTVAAHHLIPGKASLKRSSLYKRYMKKRGTVKLKIDKKPVTLTIKRHIGYNVNGSHNGVWLPGNYAIRGDDSPNGRTWSTLAAGTGAMRMWCVAYIAAVTKWSGGQLHDAHGVYNTNVRNILNKISQALLEHQIVCGECKKKEDGSKILPPYRVKERLYNISIQLREYTRKGPRGWKDPFSTSSQFIRIRNNPEEFKEFERLYSEAWSR